MQSHSVLSCSTDRVDYPRPPTYIYTSWNPATYAMNILSKNDETHVSYNQSDFKLVAIHNLLFLRFKLPYVPLASKVPARQPVPSLAH